MNTKQLIVLPVFAILLAGVIAFPPFQTKLLGSTVANGHHFILSPPNRLSRVDSATVALRAGLVVAAGAALFFACKGKH